MTHVDWSERWSSGRTGFHLHHPNPALVRFAARLQGAKRVLVPLCGKSHDLSYLAEAGHDVLGVELVDLAARAYFDEKQQVPLEEHVGRQRKLSAERVSVVVGDIFDVQVEAFAACDAVYDRAALIALPAAIRPRYAAHLTTGLLCGARMLLVTIDYPEGSLEGPPFRVPAEEVYSLYGPHWNIEELTHGPAADPPARFVERGIPLEETVWLLTRKTSAA
ncbi:MAG: thiopurine S-methyltransferase [Myxococcota bacterium]